MHACVYECTYVSTTKNSPPSKTSLIKIELGHRKFFLSVDYCYDGDGLCTWCVGGMYDTTLDLRRWGGTTKIGNEETFYEVQLPDVIHPCSFKAGFAHSKNLATSRRLTRTYTAPAGRRLQTLQISKRWYQFCWYSAYLVLKLQYLRVHL